MPNHVNQTDRHTDRHTDRQTDTQTDTQTHIQTDRHTYRHTHRQTDRHTYTQTHIQTDTQTDTQTGRQIHRQTYMQTDRQTRRKIRKDKDSWDYDFQVQYNFLFKQKNCKPPVSDFNADGRSFSAFSPQFRVQSGPIYCLLQQLIKEAGSVAVHEEVGLDFLSLTSG